MLIYPAFLDVSAVDLIEWVIFWVYRESGSVKSADSWVDHHLFTNE